jgi:hypothetical protein
MPEALSVPVPMVVEPFLKDTVPVGVPEAEGLTVAVKVIFSPYSAGFNEEVTVVVVFSVTFSSRVAEVEERKLPAPA